MAIREANLSSDGLLSRVQVLTLILALMLLVASIVANWLGLLQSFSYFWLDVVLVHFLCALPIAGILTTWILRSFSNRGCLLAASGLFALCLVIMLRADPLNENHASPELTTILFLRGLLALGVALAGTLGLAVTLRLRARVAAGHRPRSSELGPAFTVLCVCLLWLAPAIYTLARTQHDSQKLAVLLRQSRLGEAYALAQRLRELNPHANWQGHPLTVVIADLGRNVQAIEAGINTPLPATATGEERLSRARDLAILGRTAEAIETLSTAELSEYPDAWNLLGTIYEARGEWQAGRENYLRAQQTWESLPKSAESTANRIRALTGIAYCERKLGHYVEAEKAYLALLALSPGADNHFLLAQFYEDTQRAALAQTHAQRAIALAPERYSEEGRKLIDKLVTLHFGCWGVRNSEGSLVSEK